MNKYVLSQHGRKGRREADDRALLADLELFKKRKARFIFFKD